MRVRWNNERRVLEAAWVDVVVHVRGGGQWVDAGEVLRVLQAVQRAGGCAPTTCRDTVIRRLERMQGDGLLETRVVLARRWRAGGVTKLPVREWRWKGEGRGAGAMVHGTVGVWRVNEEMVKVGNGEMVKEGEGGGA